MQFFKEKYLFLKILSIACLTIKKYEQHCMNVRLIVKYNGIQCHRIYKVNQSDIRENVHI